MRFLIERRAYRELSMTFDEFKIGMEFACGAGVYHCTHKGTRTVIAILGDQVEILTMRNGETVKKLLSRSEAEEQGWLNGPPYAVAEIVFDEYDFEECGTV